MEKLNYELVGKKATVDCMLSGEIKASELSKFYLVDIDNQEVRLFNDDATFDEVMKAINNPNVLFVQSSSCDELEDDDEEWGEDILFHTKKKKRSR